MCYAYIWHLYLQLYYMYVEHSSFVILFASVLINVQVLFIVVFLDCVVSSQVTDASSWAPLKQYFNSYKFGVYHLFL